MRNQKRLGADFVRQLQRQLHIVQRFIRLAVLQFGHAAQLKKLRAAFTHGQMRQQNGKRRFIRVFERKSRIRQPAGGAQFLNHRIIFAQRQQHVRRGRLRLRRDGKLIRLGHQLAVVALPALQIRELSFFPVAGTAGWSDAIVGNGHSDACHEVGVALFAGNAFSITRQNVAITREGNGCHGKILLLRHRRRHHAGEIKMLAFGLPFVFKMIPSVPAAPVFLGVKQRNQRDETDKAE